MSKKIQTYLNTIHDLLLKEKQEDFEQHKTLIEELPLPKRIEQGFSWSPLIVVKSGYSIGERAFVIVERTKQLNAPHKFRSGKMVNLFTKTPDTYQPEKSGVINYIKRNQMKIILNSKDLPDWLEKGSLGVDLMFDERTYLEMEKAIEQVKSAKNDRLAELRDIILGQELRPTFQKINHTVTVPSLNEAQNNAVQQIVTANDIAIVHGPPGTGKTTTIVEALKQLSQIEKTILVCAPSNAAADLLTERAASKGLNVLRVGNISRVEDSLIEHTLDGKLAAHPDSKHIKKVKIDAAKARREARKFRRNFGAKERNERRDLFKEAGDLERWANDLEERLITNLLNEAQVVTCTLVGSVGRYMEKLSYKTVIIDEAAQALQPATWIPILKAKKVILVGDPYQLPPTVKSTTAQRDGFGITLIEKGLENLPDVALLNVQYRMHEDIMSFSNLLFYNNELVAADNVKDEVFDITYNTPLEFVDTAGCGFDEKINPEYLSRYNPDEYNILREHLYQLLDDFEGKDLPEIGIISPYREQVIYMRKSIEEDARLSELENLTIDTIDAFQGQERGIIYISLVRSNEKGEIGFLKDTRRMNVAMTRAKKKLIIIGDSATLGNNNFYGKFLDYCDEKAWYRTAWEFMQ